MTPTTARRPWPVTLNYNADGTRLYGWTVGADPDRSATNDIWVRVSDASGTSIHSDLHCPGAVYQFSLSALPRVTPPFSLTASAERPTPGACPHPARRLYTWYAFDGVLCVTCSDCGTPLHGAIGSVEEWEAEQARPRHWPDRDRDDEEVSGMRQRRRRDTLLEPDDLPF
jgi:hypothetical protein